MRTADAEGTPRCAATRFLSIYLYTSLFHQQCGSQQQELKIIIEKNKHKNKHKNMHQYLPPMRATLYSEEQLPN